MAASLVSDAAALALRVTFGRAMQRHAPAFFLPGPAAAPACNRVLDEAVGVLLGTVFGVVYIAALAVLLLLLFASCVVAALAAMVVYLGRARAPTTRERRLAVLPFVLLFLLTVAVVLVVVLFLATADGEE